MVRATAARDVDFHPVGFPARVGQCHPWCGTLDACAHCLHEDIIGFWPPATFSISCRSSSGKR